jgi:hypothetical protein
VCQKISLLSHKLEESEREREREREREKEKEREREREKSNVVIIFGSFCEFDMSKQFDQSPFNFSLFSFYLF